MDQLLLVYSEVSREVDEGGMVDLMVFVWLASHVLPYLSHGNVT